MTLDPTRRFAGRVDNYRQYRPGYLAGVIQLLRERCGLLPGAAVADLGSGTGIMTAQLLEAGARVWGVEPAKEMREAAERQLGGRAGFTSVAGSAQDTTLGTHSVSLVTACQAFHWFDPAGSRAEALLHRHAPEYAAVRKRRAHGPAMRTFFGREPERAVFANRQVLDFEGLKGRAMSSSYVPEPDDPAHGPLLAGLRAAFERHEREGRVTFPYETLVFFGQPGRS